ncbi:DUF1793-domain-containing protein [Stereum hirsutum FP-91666 SS1]|uniref:DUF1793-domain-containing protein n=1 Tax=Stereum hirsutum (strain FP-91666) TaxID=721885 RepID=UPI000444A368|nr:DUF1793-domain-containing protein [Stereum hirsutum FP-91666 SS1]EIM85296.1 DUF1793-domain-containing protein [Stereum hirsutum FP-91666 SS1]
MRLPIPLSLPSPSLLILTSLLPNLASAASWTADPFIPHAYPLAVRSPYLSTWLPQGNGTALNGGWPQFWGGSTIGWAGIVRVDGSSYTFLGDPAVSSSSGTLEKATQNAARFTATMSVFEMTAGSVDVNVTFLSPVEPTDLVKQSTPFSYMSISVAPNDGSAHSVQVYSDISAEWVFGNTSALVNWTTTASGSDVMTHMVQLQEQEVYVESGDRVQQGAIYYSATSSATYQTGADTTVRGQFVANGTLGNSQDTNFRAIEDDWPVFAFSQDFGSVSSGSSSSMLFSVGHVRDPAVQYIVAGGALQDRSLYFWSEYDSVSDLISAFHTSFPTALSTAQSFDSQISSDAGAISAEYEGIVAISLRQVFAGVELTISKEQGGDGSWNSSDLLVFMKEISSDGNVNTVDVIMPAWPAFLYTNPALGKALLQPLFEYQATGQYPNKYSVHDLGAAYPKAIGHNDGKDEAMPLEESGNMLILTLSHYQKTNDSSLIETYSSLLDQWTQFLISEALIPSNQISTDDFAGSLANQTNLAIKGIIGIRAMAEIWSILGDEGMASNYTSIAEGYVSQWEGLAMDSQGTHLTLSYGNDSSWGLAYNLYADKLLGLNLFPQSIYDTQASWYSSVKGTYGIPLDTRHTYTKSDWQIWMASALDSTSTTVRDTFITGVYAYVSGALGGNKEPLSDWYDTVSGVNEGFRARPVVGGHLALVSPAFFLLCPSGQFVEWWGNACRTLMLIWGDVWRLCGFAFGSDIVGNAVLISRIISPPSSIASSRSHRRYSIRLV